jgi:hypothetical protein
MDIQKCAELHVLFSRGDEGRGDTKFFTEGSLFYYVLLLNQLMRLYRILSGDGECIIRDPGGGASYRGHVSLLLIAVT